MHTCDCFSWLPRLWPGSGSWVRSWGVGSLSLWHPASPESWAQPVWCSHLWLWKSRSGTTRRSTQRFYGGRYEVQNPAGQSDQNHCGSGVAVRKVQPQCPWHVPGPCPHDLSSVLPSIVSASSPSLFLYLRGQDNMYPLRYASYILFPSCTNRNPSAVA